MWRETKNLRHQTLRNKSKQQDTHPIGVCESWGWVGIGQDKNEVSADESCFEKRTVGRSLMDQVPWKVWFWKLIWNAEPRASPSASANQHPHCSKIHKWLTCTLKLETPIYGSRSRSQITFELPGQLRKILMPKLHSWPIKAQPPDGRNKCS